MGIEEIFGKPEKVESLFEETRKIFDSWKVQLSLDEAMYHIIWEYRYLEMAGISYANPDSPDYQNKDFKEDILKWLGELERKAEEVILSVSPRRPYKISQRQYFFAQIEHFRVGPPRRSALEQLDSAGIINIRDYSILPTTS